MKNQKNSKNCPNFPNISVVAPDAGDSIPYLQRAVNRQPGYRPGDQEVVLRPQTLLETF